jgi:hypothetical protein
VRNLARNSETVIAVAPWEGERASFYSGTVIAAAFLEGQVGSGRVGSGRVKCCWSSPAESFLVLRPAGLMSHTSGSCLTLLTHFGLEGGREGV